MPSSSSQACRVGSLSNGHAPHSKVSRNLDRPDWPIADKQSQGRRNPTTLSLAVDREANLLVKDFVANH